MSCVGRPPKYKTADEMQAKIDEYFDSCAGTVLTDAEGAPILNKNGQPIVINVKPPTITGLALAIGFTSRQALLNYQGKKGFIDTITRAKSRVEKYAEERLYDKEGCNGAKFSLANNFNGWSDKKDDLDRAEQQARIAQIEAQTKKLSDDSEIEIVDDGFLEALKASAKEDWKDED